MKEIVLDIETTVSKYEWHLPKKYRKNPAYNKLAAIRLVCHLEIGKVIPDVSNDLLNLLKAMGDVDDTPVLLIGHNIDFDLQYLLKYASFTNKFMKSNVPVWDTMLVHYILTGQRSKFISLEELAEEYGIDFSKSEKIKEMFEREEEPSIHDLTYHVVGDVNVTHEIYQKQKAMLETDTSLMDMVFFYNQARKHLSVMTHHGVSVDTHKLEALYKENHEEIQKKYDRRKNYVAALVDNYCDKKIIKDALPAKCSRLDDEYQSVLKEAAGSITLTSKTFIDLFTKGVLPSVKINLPLIDVDSGMPVVYKSGVNAGKQKYKKYTIPLELDKTLADVLDLLATSKPTSGDENALLAKSKEVDALESYLGDILYQWIEVELSHRELTKLHGYLHEYRLLCNVTGGRLHSTYNMVATPTGRESSSLPNLQNMPAVIKDLIIYEAKADWNKLEFHTAAMISGDPEMKRLIESGVDIHEKLTIDIFGAHTPEFRKIEKGVFYSWQYGAGLKTIMANNPDIPEGTIKLVYDYLNHTFRGHVRHRKDTLTRLKKHKMFADPRKITKPYYELYSLTKKYCIEAKPDYNGELAPSFTNTSNFPNQGLAADIHKVWICVFNSHEDRPADIINTIHDEVMFVFRTGENFERLQRYTTIVTNETKEYIAKIVGDRGFLQTELVKEIFPTMEVELMDHVMVLP